MSEQQTTQLGLNQPCAAEPWAGQQIGHWQLGEQIGSGGMGQVYAAERIDGEVAQAAAIKIVRADLNDQAHRLRFEQERQIMATLTHLRICRLLDAGTTRGGDAYLVMERVDGMTLDRWANDRTDDEIIAKVIELCDAVAHAHQRLVIHRDLKPSNVMIDRDARIKVLDFGTAKLLGEAMDSGVETIGVAPLTPRYAAPEQIRGQAVSTATDVYAIAIMLYELLLGRSPYGETTSGPYQTATKVGDAEVDLRNTGLDKDLVAVLHQALAREPEQRYATVVQFADDLRAYRERRPVAARQPSAVERLRYWRRRNPALATSLVALLAVLSVASVALAWQADALRQQRDAAQAVTQFTLELFQSANPMSENFESEDPAQVVAAGIARFETNPPRQPLIKAQLAASLAELAGANGDYDGAARLYARALSLDGSNVDWLLGATAVKFYTGDSDIPLDQLEGLATDAAVSPAQRAEAHTLLGIADQLAGDYAAAKQRMQTALSLADEEALIYADYLDNLAFAEFELGETDTAMAHIEQALAQRERVVGADHLAVGVSLNNIGYYQSRMGNIAGAIASYRRAVEIGEARLGADNPTLAVTYGNLANKLSQIGEFAAAEAQHRRALEILLAEHGPLHYSVGITKNNLATTLEAQGDYQAAVDITEAAVEAIASQPLETAILGINLARRLFLAGDRDGAAARFVPAMRWLVDNIASDNDRYVNAQLVQALLLSDGVELPDDVPAPLGLAQEYLTLLSDIANKRCAVMSSRLEALEAQLNRSRSLITYARHQAGVACDFGT